MDIEMNAILDLLTTKDVAVILDLRSYWMFHAMLNLTYKTKKYIINYRIKG